MKFDFQTVLRAVLPPLLGALGALLATASPAYYAAVCGGGLVRVVGA